ncbi:MAG: beta-lactamase family protein [Candidatus Aminicenantes bacterium]|nr:MAG: beta-lactamase family protein [Candidatus Aminicenantes bacterium]
MILQALEKTGVSSMAVAVAKDGRIIWEEGFGLANREKQIKSTPHAIYALASISKPITATGLTILVERGLVDLNKPANDYLGKEKLTVYAGKASEVTVKRLLHHTAGLPMHWHLFHENGPSRPPGMDESIRRYGIIVAPPGEAFNYSNFGYGVIGHIISRVSGKNYAEFMKTEVFEPLGITRTSVNILHDLRDSVAVKYTPKLKPISVCDYDHRGASAVFSSAHDLVRFGMFHLKNHLKDQKPIIKDKTIDAMQQEIDPKVPDSGYGFGWGWGDMYGYRFVNHNGGIAGVSTRLTLIPSENIASVLLCNGGNIDPWRIESEIFAALLPEYAKKLQAEEKKTEEEKPQPSSFPDSLIGEWQGRIKTYESELSAKMTFVQDNEVSLELEGKTLTSLNMKTPLGRMGFSNGIFKGLFFGNLTTSDTAQVPHVIFITMKLRGDRLDGYAAAIAMDRNFCLPNWIELTKVQEHKEN